MVRITSYLVCRIYLGLLLAAAAAVLPYLTAERGLPYTALSGILLTVLAYSTVRPRSPAFNVVFHVILVFLAPLVLAAVIDGLGLESPYAAGLAAVTLSLPAFLLLDESLKKDAGRRHLTFAAPGQRRTTNTFTSLAVCSLAVMVGGPLVGRPVLLLAGAALLLYLVITLTATLISVPRHPFAADTVLKRIIAGTPGGIYLSLNSRASLKLYCRVTPADTWVRARPTGFIFKPGGAVRLELSFTPALAGECQPSLLLSSLDPRGLVRIDQRLEPLHLHVIPMARYAEWLARKYLEQAAAGVIAEDRLALEQSRAPKMGTEYLESRAYQPGDPLKDIDWKHSAKLNQLIVNTYGESGRQTAVIAANLEVASAAEADRLAFNLITVALTLARENIPAALAVYDRHRVVRTTGIVDTLEILKQTLSLVRQVTVEEADERHLEPTDVARVRRNIRQLQQTDSEPARRLLEILTFEHRAVEEVARNHPATLALSAVTGRVPAPATIFLVSQLNHDAEAVLVATEKLARLKYSIVPVENKQQMPSSPRG